MDFRLSEEQQMFRDALRRWVGKDYGFETRREIVRSASGVAPAAWAALAELGAIAIAIPEDAGGLGGSSAGTMVVMQEIGRGLVAEPYFATVMAAEFLKRASGPRHLLERIASGGLQLACALNEPGAGHALSHIHTTVWRDEHGFVLDGSKCAVIHGAQAGGFIVSARSGGQPHEQAGITLLYVPREAAGLTVKGYRTYDGQRGADVVFDHVRLPAAALVGTAGEGWELLEAATDFGVAMLCAEAVGAIEAANVLTLEYLKTRKQFGVPIGSFQALQHRMADMFIHQEQARSLMLLAAVKVEHAAPGERRRLISVAKVRAGKAARFVGQQAIQLHGGMGMTDEMAISHYFKRLTAIEMTLGTTDFHRARFIAEPAFGVPA